MKLISKELKNHQFVYAVLSIILLYGLYLRIYRTGDILGFYFDQGRDALVIWDFIHTGKLFLIGPTTGIAGIFRGPLYYYLIAPFYYMGNGNSVWPANFLSITTILGIGMMYYLGWKMHSRTAGLFAAFIGAFSYDIFWASRWLSNPTPMFLLSMLLVYSLWQIVNGKKIYWLMVGLISGLSLFHFGSSGEFFYFPAIFAVLIWKKKSFPNFKIILGAVGLFLLTASPLILFDLRHDFLLFNNIKNFIFGEETFKLGFSEILKIRIRFYWDVFRNIFFVIRRDYEARLFLGMLLGLIWKASKLIKNTGVKLLLILIISPLVGLLFFQGNEVYGYYMTGYLLIAILFIGILFGELYKSYLGKIFLVIFLYYFLQNNFEIINSKLNDNVDGPTSIGFKVQKEAIEWVYKDASNQSFNVDVYVPPVIPYAYDYLFKWFGTTKYYEPSTEQIDLLYTLYEVDPPHPERLQAWMDRQEGIGEVLYEEKFGGITVQRRMRIEASSN